MENFRSCPVPGILKLYQTFIPIEEEITYRDDNIHTIIIMRDIDDKYHDLLRETGCKIKSHRNYFNSTPKNMNVEWDE